MPWPTESRQPRQTPVAVTTVRLSTNLRIRTNNSIGRSCQLVLQLSDFSSVSIRVPEVATPRLLACPLHLRFFSGGLDSISSSSRPQKNCDKRDKSCLGLFNLVPRYKSAGWRSLRKSDPWSYKLTRLSCS